MFFKKKLKDYSKEIVFKFYSKSEVLFLDFFNFLKSQDIIIKSIVGNEEYFTDFDENISKQLKEGLIVNLEDSNSLHLSVNQYSENNIYCSSYYFTYNENLISKLQDFISGSDNKILYAILTNYYDVKWQNEESISNYKVNKKNLKGLSYSNDLWDEKCVDISKNYGRSVFKDGISYIAGYCSWFGGIIDRNTFDEIDFAYSKAKLKNGLFEIKLLEDLNGKYSNYREEQKKLLNLLNVI